MIKSAYIIYESEVIPKLTKVGIGTLIRRLSDNTIIHAKRNR